MPTRAAFSFVLHSHLPWVLHHGRWPHGVDWLNEAAAETYLPLWRDLHARTAGTRALGVTIGLSPVLCEQLAHPDYPSEFVSYLEQKIEAARDDRAAFTAGDDLSMAALAERWERFYRSTLEDFMGPHGSNLVARFRRLEEAGAIEIITCGATHGYLPLLATDAAAEFQIQTAVATHRRHFGRAPRGIWLPECAYRPAGPWPSPAIEREGGFGPDDPTPPHARVGVEELLAAHGLRYFFVDSHLIAGGRPLGTYAERFDAIRRLVPAETAAAPRQHTTDRAYRVGPTAVVSCFGRDAATTVQVWSGEHGYPGDAAYLDFHKKRFPGGHRYWAVTHPKADMADKVPYQPLVATERTAQHADHFVRLLESTLAGATGGSRMLTAMFDAELFGHWWFEGPQFLAEVVDRLVAGGRIEPQSAGAFLERHGAPAIVDLPEGSWGDGGGHKVWLNETTRWTWVELHRAEARFEALVGRARARSGDALLERLAAQTARELLLAQASDWQFLITTIAARDYAELRIRRHFDDFDTLATLTERRLAGSPITDTEERLLGEIETRDRLFNDLDWRAYGARALATRA